MREVLILGTEREGYGIDQVNHTMTVGDLIAFLSDFDEDREVYLSFDRGYTYGGIHPGKFTDADYDEEHDDLELAFPV